MPVGHDSFDFEMGRFTENPVFESGPADGPLGILTVRDVLRARKVDDLRRVMRARRQARSFRRPVFSFERLDNFCDGFVLGILAVAALMGSFWPSVVFAGLIVFARAVVPWCTRRLWMSYLQIQDEERPWGFLPLTKSR